MRVASINIDRNIEIWEDYVQQNPVPPEVSQSIQEINEAIMILMERFQRNRLGRKSSEKSKRPKKEPSGEDDGDSDGKRTPRDQLPSERYPNIPIIENDIGIHDPICPCCQGKMCDTGMKDICEMLTTIPRKYLILRNLKKKYACKNCYTGIMVAPTPPRIVPGSSYSDDMVIDVTLSKYCDLLPMERYVQMAARNGVVGLPANSLIGLTHYLARFLEVINEKIKQEVLSSFVICADETPHNMLEGDEKSRWYLWGFSSETACFFTIQDTRSGQVAGELLKQSNARYLLTDVFSGYHKAVVDVNRFRQELNIPLLIQAFCNAHSRRKFKDGERHFAKEVKAFIASYRHIFHLESLTKKLSRQEKIKIRDKMRPYFEEIKRICEKLKDKFSPRNTIGIAINYFLKNYEGLTRGLENPDVPIHNNVQEGLLRPSVVGRKTWYGTHSKRGAMTASIHLSIIGSCKLNGVNPQEYFPFVVSCIHDGKDPPSPYEYKLQQNGPNTPSGGTESARDGPS